MYRLMVLYPNGADKHFDVDYYRDKHMPMVEGFIGADMIRTEISWGTAGLNGAEAPYMCIGTLYMKIMAGLDSAFANHMDDMVNDIPNYTNIEPIAQIEEIV